MPFLGFLSVQKKENAFCNLIRVESQLKEKNMHVVAQTAKNLPAMQETWAPSLGQEDLLEKRMDSHSSVLAWRIPWTQEPAGLQSMGLQRVRHNWATNTFTSVFPLHVCVRFKKKATAVSVLGQYAVHLEMTRNYQAFTTFGAFTE